MASKSIEVAQTGQMCDWSASILVAKSNHFWFQMTALFVCNDNLLKTENDLISNLQCQGHNSNNLEEEGFELERNPYIGNS